MSSSSSSPPPSFTPIQKRLLYERERERNEREKRKEEKKEEGGRERFLPLFFSFSSSSSYSPLPLPPFSPIEQPPSLEDRISTDPTFRANPFPEVTDLFCRLPLSALFYSTRGCSPWRPAAVISTARPVGRTSLGFSWVDRCGRAPDTPKSRVLFQSSHPISG